MFIEIKIALNFFLSYLYDKLPRRRVNLLGEELEKYLKLKLLSTNWPTVANNSPPPETSFLNESRSFYFNKQDLYLEPCLIAAANESAMDIKEIFTNLPDYLKMFIEPGLVAYLLEPFDFTSHSSSSHNKLDRHLKILYKLPQIDVNSLSLNTELTNGESAPPSFTSLKKQSKPQNPKTLSPESNDLWSPSSSSSSSSCSSSSSSLSASILKLKLLENSFTEHLTVDPVPQQAPSTEQHNNTGRSIKPPNYLFTPAEFAQTKFGSTKTKNSFNPTAKPRHNQQQHQVQSQQQQFNKNINQTHNSDFAAYIKQKSALQQQHQQLLKTPTSPVQSKPLMSLNRPMKGLSMGQNQGLFESGLFDLDSQVTSPNEQITANLLISSFLKQQNFNSQPTSYLSNLFDSNTKSLSSSSTSSSSSDNSLIQVPQYLSNSSSFNESFQAGQQQHQQSFDLIVNSTIKEMIDNYDEDDEKDLEKLKNAKSIENF